MNARTKHFNVSQSDLAFARNYRLSIAAAVIATLFFLASMAPGERTVEVLGSAQAAAAEAESGNGPTGYFPDLFNASGAIEVLPATF